MIGSSSSEQAAAPKEEVVISYIDGGVPKKQVWTVEAPDAIQVDQRTEDWAKPKIHRADKILKTPYRLHGGVLRRDRHRPGAQNPSYARFGPHKGFHCMGLTESGMSE